jgi:hypothetical protein
MMIFSCHKIPKFAAPGGGAACLWSIYSRPQIKKIPQKAMLAANDLVTLYADH